MYGDTSTHWGGTCRPLDAGVFTGRPGFPAWPFTRKELDPAYAEACQFPKLCGPYYDPCSNTAAYNFTAEYWANKVGSDYETLDLAGFQETVYQQVSSCVQRFQTRTVCDRTLQETCVQVILNAALTGVVPASGTVSYVEVTGLSSESEPLTPFKLEADVWSVSCRSRNASPCWRQRKTNKIFTTRDSLVNSGC